jgi:hypothetical protein
MSLTFLILYFATAGWILLILLHAFFTDRAIAKTDRISWTVMLLAATFWIIVLPISLVEQLVKSNIHYPMIATQIQPAQDS